MIHFKELPPTDVEAPRLLRVRPGPPLRVTLLNTKYVGLDTHYWGGHTVACPGEATCKACHSGLVAIFAGYIFCQLEPGSRVAIVALTPVMCAILCMNRDPVGGLLGMKVTFRRKTKEPNSGVLTTFHGIAPEFDPQTIDRLIMRVRIIFKDYCIKDSGETNEPVSQRGN